MKKPSLKEQVKKADHTISRIFYETYKEIGEARVLELILASFHEDLYDLDKDIEREKDFANENKSGAYKSAGTEARKTIKHMQKTRKEHLKQIKMFKQIIKQKSKTDKMW